MKKRVVIAVAVVLLGVAFFVLRNDSEDTPLYESTMARTGDVVNVVSVTGHVEPLERIELAFTAGGRLAALPKTEGSAVATGEPVALLDAAVLGAGVREAEARLRRERALLADLIAPLRSVERAVKDTSLASALRDRDRALLSAQVALERAYAYADDAVREKADVLFNEGRGEDPKFGLRFTYGTTDYILQLPMFDESLVNEGRAAAGAALDAIAQRLASDRTDVRPLLEETRQDLSTIDTFLNDLADVVNRYIPSDAEAQTVYETFRGTVSSARTALGAAQSEVGLALKEMDATASNYASARTDLSLALAGVSDESVLAQEATVAVAETAVEGLVAQLDQTVLTAPLGGRIVATYKEVGEVVAPYETVADLYVDDAYEIIVYIPEADIASVALGQGADVTFDAFDLTQVFSAEVVRIALRETVRDGVPTYKTTLVFTDEPDDSLVVRPGMTVDVDILTARADDTVFVPSRSVLRDGGRTYVRLVQNGEIVERDVVAGLRGSDGTTAISAGIAEGDEVVLFIEGS